jgi:hypothetical protein
MVEVVCCAAVKKVRGATLIFPRGQMYVSTCTYAVTSYVCMNVQHHAETYGDVDGTYCIFSFHVLCDQHHARAMQGKEKESIKAQETTVWCR